MRADGIVVSGFADWPGGRGRWFGGSFLSCGRPAFSKMSSLMRTEDPASLGIYWDNWLAKKQRDRKMGQLDASSLNIIQDVPRGGPHPRVSTTLSPDGSSQLRFGGGLCPDAGAMMGEQVTEPSPIADWISKLRKHGTLGVTIVRHTPLPSDLSFQPASNPQLPQPSTTNTILCWFDVEGRWGAPPGFHAPDFALLLSDEIAARGAPRSTDADQPKETGGMLVASCLTLCAAALARGASRALMLTRQPCPCGSTCKAAVSLCADGMWPPLTYPVAWVTPCTQRQPGSLARSVSFQKL